MNSSSSSLARKAATSKADEHIQHSLSREQQQQHFDIYNS
jgi:hypothetical protein